MMQLNVFHAEPPYYNFVFHFLHDCAFVLGRPWIIHPVYKNDTVYSDDDQLENTIDSAKSWSQDLWIGSTLFQIFAGIYFWTTYPHKLNGASLTSDIVWRGPYLWWSVLSYWMVITNLTTLLVFYNFMRKGKIGNSASHRLFLFVLRLQSLNQSLIYWLFAGLIWFSYDDSNWPRKFDLDFD